MVILESSMVGYDYGYPKKIHRMVGYYGYHNHNNHITINGYL